MKYLKLYEQFDFDENDPFGEEIEYVKPTFLSWLKKNYPDENTWDKINYINCCDCRLTSLEGIEKLANLKELYCNDNYLTSLERIKLKNLVNLEALGCSNNQLTSLKGIENLVNLEALGCSNNQLTSLEGIENLVNLEILNCDNNQFTSLEGIENLVNLKKLRCVNNQFTIEYKNYLRDYCKKRKIISII